MKPIGAMLIASALAVLGGCMVVPVNPGYDAGLQGYAAPAPVYYGAPAYYGPSIGFGIYGGGAATVAATVVVTDTVEAVPITQVLLEVAI